MNNYENDPSVNKKGLLTWNKKNNKSIIFYSNFWRNAYFKLLTFWKKFTEN